MLPCHKKLAELYSKFSDGMNLRVELMGPKTGKPCVKA